MDNMIIFATKNRLGCCEGTSTAFASSHYLEKYKKNREGKKEGKKGTGYFMRCHKYQRGKRGQATL